MCEKCVEIDVKIRRMREIALRLLDQQTLDGIAALVKELEAPKAALHPEQRQFISVLSRTRWSMKCSAERTRPDEVRPPQLAAPILL